MEAPGPEEQERVPTGAVRRAEFGPCRVFGWCRSSVEHQGFINGRMLHAA